MYPGTMAIIEAATRPARSENSSEVKKYVTIEVKDEKKGAKNTQTFLTSMEMWKKLRMW